MDINQLASALKISSISEERAKNEMFLSKSKLVENYAPALLNIACESQYPPEVQLNAAIQLKNFIISNWKYGNNESVNLQMKFSDEETIIVISDNDKNYIKTHILEALVYSTSNIKLMKQFNQSIKKIAKLDFENWKEFFMSKVLDFFKSGDDKKIFGGIVAFYQVSKVHEFECGQYKASYKKSFEMINEYLLNFLSGLMPNFLTKEVAVIIYKIFKIYFKTIQMDISPLIYEEKNFENWNLYIITAIRNKIPENLSVKTEKTSEVDELNKNMYWKLKRLSFQLIYRLYQKYGYSEIVEKAELETFAKLIENSYVKVYFDVCMSTLERSKSEFMSDHVLCLVYKFLSQMMVRYHLVSEIEKNLETILKDHLVQNAMITLKDIELWTNDPKTYINKQFDITENYYITRYSVCQFVKTICTFKKKNEKGKPVGKSPYYEGCYKYLVSILEIYEAQISSGSETDVRIKESVMYILQSIAPTIMSRSKDSVEKLIEVFVLKEFESKFPPLRERACTFIENFGDFKFQNMNLLHEITKKICFILDQETELPVKVMASISAPILLKHSGVKELLAPHVPKLLEIYLNLVNTVDLEEILEGLETIISRFNHQVKDYAVALTFELVKLFKKHLESEESDENKGEKLMVIEGVLRTLLKIIELFINNPEVYPKIENSIHEILSWGLQSENFENLDDTLDFIHTVLKKGNTVSEKTWSYFPEIVFTLIGTPEEVEEFKQAYKNVEFEGIGYENIQDVIPILCYYITKDPNTFLTGVDKYNIPYLNRAILLVQKIISLAKHKKEYYNIRYALRLLMVVIETFKAEGKINNIVKDCLTFLITEISQPNIKQTYKTALFEAIACSFYYNPGLAIQVVEEKNFIQNLFEMWVASIPNFKFDSEIKRTHAAFTSIISIPPEHQNKDILKGMPVLVKEIINLSGLIDKKRKKNTPVPITATFDDEEGEVDRDEQLNQLLSKAKPSLNDFKSPEEDEEDLIEDEEDEDDEEWDEFSNLNNITPLDHTDSVLFLKDTFTSIASNQPTYYEELMKLIDSDSRVRLDTYIKNAEISTTKK